MGIGNGSILIVQESAEDELQHQLEHSGYQISNVSTESDCLSLLHSSSPDLILFSLPFSQVDASSLLHEILRIDVDLPVALICADSSKCNLLPLLKAGASNFYHRQVNDNQLLIYFVQAAIDRHFTRLEQRANEAKLEHLNLKLIENLKILERDQQAGFRVQQGMMPDSPLVLGKATFDHQIVPSLILSGDFIDYFTLADGRTLFYIADVSGHGASSAFVTVLLKSLSRRLQDDAEVQSTAEILSWLNQELLKCELEQHVTMFLGILDEQLETLHYSNAAQFPAAILSAANETKFLEIGGLPLGLYQSPEYDSRAVKLPKGFNLVMFSDGVFEIMSEQTLKAKEERLLAVVKCAQNNVISLTEQLGIKDHTMVPDDIAVFTIAGVA